jgi:hypothetical protein
MSASDYMTTVGELISTLKEFDQDRVVIIARDSEGNGYSPFSCATGNNDAYRPETTWFGYAGIEHLTPELTSHGYSDEDVIEDGIPCVVLCPIN